jgi:hypothetical protein
MEGNKHLGDLSIDVGIILKWMLKEKSMTGFGQSAMVDFYINGYERTSSIKDR